MSPDTSDLDLETRPAVSLNRGEEYKEQPETPDEEPFGDEDDAEVRYRTLEWWFVSPGSAEGRQSRSDAACEQEMRDRFVAPVVSSARTNASG